METPTNQVVRVKYVIPERLRCQVKTAKGIQCDKRYIYKGYCKTHLPKAKKEEWKEVDALFEQQEAAYGAARNIGYRIVNATLSDISTPELLGYVNLLGPFVTWTRVLRRLCLTNRCILVIRPRYREILDYGFKTSAADLAFAMMELGRRGVPIPTFPEPVIDIPEVPCEDLTPPPT